MDCRLPSDADRAEVARNLRRLYLPPSEQYEAANAPDLAEQLFPWPMWDAPSFRDLRAQRLKVLEILGVEDLPFLHAPPGSGATDPERTGTRSYHSVPTVKPPQEEVDIDLSDIEDV